MAEIVVYNMASDPGGDRWAKRGNDKELIAFFFLLFFLSSLSTCKISPISGPAGSLPATLLLLGGAGDGAGVDENGVAVVATLDGRTAGHRPGAGAGLAIKLFHEVLLDGGAAPLPPLALRVRLALDVLQLPPQRRVRVDLVRRLEDGLAPARGESVGL